MRSTTLIAAAALAVALCAPASAAPKGKGPARVLLTSIWTAEPLMMSALRKRNEFAMSGHAMKLAAAVGETDRETALTSSCFKAADSMANLARGLAQGMSEQPDAHHIEVVQSDYEAWRSATDRCEAEVGEKRRRSLVLDRP